MRIVDDLLVLLADGHKGPYRLIHKYFEEGVVSRGLPSSVNEQALRITLSRLKKNGLVKNTDGVWEISKAGQKIAEKILWHKKIRDNPKRVERNMIIAFDIPEALRKKRYWLRAELAALRFTQLQQSVWFGPSPLPQEFIDELNMRRLLQFMKFFKASEEEIV